MKKEIKKVWVKALRSGKYKKDKGALKTERGYCCLGVLTDLYIKRAKYGSWVEKVKMNGEKDYVYEYKDIKASGSLSQNVMKWAGLTERDPIVKKRDNTFNISLAGLNDGESGKPGKSFKTIADIIEENL